MVKFISFLLICTCSNLIASQSTTSEDSSDNFIRKKPSIPIINLDNNPKLKKYYDKNEQSIPSSRSNVRETDENGKEALGFLAFLTEYDPSPKYLEKKNEREYLEEKNEEESKKVNRSDSKKNLKNFSSCFPIRKKKKK